MSDECAAAGGARAQAAFQRRLSGNPTGRWRGSRNRATLGAASLVDGESRRDGARVREKVARGNLLQIQAIDDCDP
jgi:hypothetical protein